MERSIMRNAAYILLPQPPIRVYPPTHPLPIVTLFLPSNSVQHTILPAFLLFLILYTFFFLFFFPFFGLRLFFFFGLFSFSLSITWEIRLRRHAAPLFGCSSYLPTTPPPQSQSSSSTTKTTIHYTRTMMAISLLHLCGEKSTLS